MTIKNLYGKDGHLLRANERVTLLSGEHAILLGWSPPDARSPLGWVRIKAREVHDREVYPTAINAEFR